MDLDTAIIAVSTSLAYSRMTGKRKNNGSGKGNDETEDIVVDEEMRAFWMVNDKVGMRRRYDIAARMKKQ
jgi:hypothetical protein